VKAAGWIGLLTTGALSLVPLGCAPEPTPEAFPEMAFSVDSTRLGEGFAAADGGMRLRAPAGWSAAPAETLAEVMRLLGQKASAGGDEPRLRALYREPSSGAALAVSDYDGPCTPERRDRLAALHERAMRERDPEAEVKSGRYGLHGVEIVQLRAVQSDKVLFKLLASRPPGPLFQLDYILPRGVYVSELRAVESSIGSLEAP
jgi:hypothetical protein